MRLLIIIFTLLCAKTMAANTNDTGFSVLPSECIVAEQGDSCDMTLDITYPELPSETYCLTVDERSLGCWPNNKLPISLDLEISQDSSFSLSDKNGKHTYSVFLKLKFRKASNYRRRVKNPWSLF